MIKPPDPRQLAIDILERSTCLVQVGCAIADNYGIVSWGWNNPSNGMGQHAEAHAIQRGNRRRMEWATLYVASRWRKKGKITKAKPCDECMKRLIAVGISKIYYRDADGIWKHLWTGV